MARMSDSMPLIIAQTNGREVFYCPRCNAPVVDHPDAKTAHDLRLHPERARCAPLFISATEWSHIEHRVRLGLV